MNGAARRRPLGERAAAAELDVVGMRPDRERAGRHGEVVADCRTHAGVGMARSPGWSTSHARSGVAHDAQRQPEPARFDSMAAERSGAVGEGEAASGGNARHVGAVVAPVGDEGDAREPGDPCQVGRERKVGMGHDHLLHACAVEVVDAEADGPVEAAAGRDHDLEPALACPCRHLVGVAHDGDRQCAGSVDDTVRHRPRQRGALGRVECRRQPRLGVGERLDRYEDGDGVVHATTSNTRVTGC